ncbi:carbohydrate binding domain-containing protein [Streptomyces decoyicus]|uniref:hypothetical protein n=1 Tax=Streptomyces decoyicus TaxID=249567 RepID=UPI00382D42BE
MADGAQSVDLNGQGPGKVSQTFTTTAGKTYTVAIGRLSSQYRAVDFRDFLDKIDRGLAVHVHLRPPPHPKAPAVHKSLLAHSRFELRFQRRGLERGVFSSPES